eukprot:jgi/Mesen1/847/ME000112S10993
MPVSTVPQAAMTGLRKVFSANTLHSPDGSLSMHRQADIQSPRPLGLRSAPRQVRHARCVAGAGAYALTLAHIWVGYSYKDSRTVNIAGRQRELDQRIAKSAVSILYLLPSSQNYTFYQQELHKALPRLYAGHYGLQHGNHTLGVSAVGSRKIKRLFRELQPQFDAIYSAGVGLLEVLDAHVNATTTTTPPQQPLTLARISPFVKSILDHEHAFFLKMNMIVDEYTRLGHDHLSTLMAITWSFAGGVLLTMVLEGLFVMRPALTSMQKLVSERFDLLRASLEAEASSRSVAKLMVGYVAHEVQEPLACCMRAIKAAGELLRDPPPVHLGGGGAGEEAAGLRATGRAALDLLREAQECCRIMSTVVSDVGDIRQLEVGSIVLVAAACDVRAVVAHVLQVVKPKSEVEMQHEVDPAVDTLHFVTDAHRLQQVLVNLLSNALKFTQEGFVKVRVSVTPAALLLFEVADTGEGLTEEVAAKLLMPFVETPDKSNLQGGTGVGLYFCKLLVDLLGGSLTVSSKVGKGSTFSFQLPLSPPARQAHVSMDIMSQSGSGGGRVQPTLFISRTSSGSGGSGDHRPGAVLHLATQRSDTMSQHQIEQDGSLVREVVEGTVLDEGKLRGGRLLVGANILRISSDAAPTSSLGAEPLETVVDVEEMPSEALHAAHAEGAGGAR